MVAQGQLPWKRDADIRLDDHSAPDARSKASQYQPFKCGELKWTEPKQPKTDEQPERFTEKGSTAIEVAGRVRGETHLRRGDVHLAFDNTGRLVVLVQEPSVNAH